MLSKRRGFKVTSSSDSVKGVEKSPVRTIKATCVEESRVRWEADAAHVYRAEFCNKGHGRSRVAVSLTRKQDGLL